MEKNVFFCPHFHSFFLFCVRLFRLFIFSLSFPFCFCLLLFVFRILKCVNDIISPRLRESILWFEHVVFQCTVQVACMEGTSLPFNSHHFWFGSSPFRNETKMLRIHFLLVRLVVFFILVFNFCHSFNVTRLCFAHLIVWTRRHTILRTHKTENFGSTRN